MKSQQNLYFVMIVLAIMWSPISVDGTRTRTGLFGAADLRSILGSLVSKTRCQNVGQRSRCSGLTSETRPSINGMASAEYKKLHIDRRNCFCDLFCGSYGDCCVDYVDKNLPSGAARVVSRYLRMATKCDALQVGKVLRWAREDPMDNIPVNHVSKCPATSVTDKLRNQCEGIFNKSDILPFVPVLGGKPFNVVFKNVFCALCHGVRDVTWFNVSYVIANHLASVSASLDWCLSQPEAHCSLRLHSPTARRLSYCKRTTNILGSPAACSDQLFTDCTAGQYDAVYECQRKRGRPRRTCRADEIIVYKNAACARCANESFYSSCLEGHISSKLIVGNGKPNFVNFNKPGLTGRPWTTMVVLQATGKPDLRPLGVPTSYSVLLHISGLGESPRCLPHQVFFADECRDILEPVDRARVTNYSESARLNCSKTISLKKGEFELLPNETLRVIGDGRVYLANEYQLEEGGLVLCIDDNDDARNRGLLSFSFSKIQSWMSLIGLILSMIGLLLQLIVYSMFSVLRNLPGKSLMCLSGSLLVAQLLFSISVRPSYGYELCVVAGAVMHYAFLAAFCWKNALAFQLCNTFRNTGQVPGRSRGTSKSFLRYSFYAWLLPAIIVAISIVINFIDPVNEYFKPSYGKGGSICWISRPGALIVSFAAPIALFIILNAILYAITVRNICVMQQAAKLAQGKSSEKRSLLLYIKLSLVFGLGWTFGFLATFSKFEPFWYLFIIFNTLQGVVIFVAFVCTKKVYNLLVSKLRTGVGSSGGTSTRSTRTGSNPAVLDNVNIMMKESSAKKYSLPIAAVNKR